MRKSNIKIFRSVFRLNFFAVPTELYKVNELT